MGVSVTISKTTKAILALLLSVSSASGQVGTHRTIPPAIQKPDAPSKLPVAPTIDEVASLAGIKGLSIDLDNMKYSKDGVERSLRGRLEELGVEVLPQGTYPVLQIYTVGGRNSFYVGYVSHDVFGVSMVLRICQLLPLENGFVSATTYSRVATGVGVSDSDSTKARAQVVNGFFDDLETLRKPVAPPVPIVASGDLTNQNIEQVYDFRNRLGWPASFTPQEKQRWTAQVEAVFSDGPASILTCNYKESMTNWIFWYEKVPPKAASLFQEWPQGPFGQIGTKALTACPANVAAAKKLTNKNAR